SLMLVMRWQLAMPGEAIPLVGKLLGKAYANVDPNTGGKILSPDGYNAFGAMHGTIMVFLAIVPLLVGGFGNYVLPLQVGAKDIPSPTLNWPSCGFSPPGGLIMRATFIPANQGAPKSGWTSSPPLSDITDLDKNMLWTGQTMWLIGMVFL